MFKRPSNIIFFIFIIIGLLYAKLYYVHFSLFLSFTPIAILPLFLKKYRYVFLSVLLGMILFNIHNIEFYYSDKNLEKFDDKNITIKGTIKEHKNFRFNSISVIQADDFYVGDENIKLPIAISAISNKSHEYVKNDSIVVLGKFQRYAAAKNLYEKDQINIARNNKISGFMLSPKIIYHKSKFSISNVIFNIRSWIINVFNDRLSFKSANFMNAIIIGSKESLEKGTIKEFSESGTIHLLAVSGLHVGFLLLILIFFKSIFGYRINIHLVVVTTVLVSYILLTGSSPSVIRAGIMSIIAILSFPMKRKIKILDVIATAGIFSLIIDPNQIFQLGFILSFTAVLSLVVIYNTIVKQNLVNALILKAGKGSFIIKGIIVSVSASIGTLPVVLYYFGKFNVFSIFANVILIPITGFNYLLGIILIVINKVPILSDFVAFIIDTSVKIMLKIISFVSDINFMKIIYKINIFELVVLLSLILIIFIIRSKKVKIVLLSVVIIVIISSLFVNTTGNHAYCFSTNNGNSCFATLDGQNILFLGKLKGRELKNIIKPYLFANNIKRLDYIIILDDNINIESKISELDIPVGFLVSSRNNFTSENYEVMNIRSIGNVIKLLNSRIYFSENNNQVMLAYSDNRFLFGQTANINGEEINTENQGIIFLMRK
ncbi:MAG: ComEC/Rec2 family competence protein [Candidatus Delongbacteria bacterium]|jgi:competence protein ComEC|nr:ComEC/Rec2 family competence protein [Candidatus Delongbacteria bacterium]